MGLSGDFDNETSHRSINYKTFPTDGKTPLSGLTFDILLTACIYGGRFEANTLLSADKQELIARRLKELGAPEDIIVELIGKIPEGNLAACFGFNINPHAFVALLERTPETTNPAEQPYVIRIAPRQV